MQTPFHGTPFHGFRGPRIPDSRPELPCFIHLTDEPDPNKPNPNKPNPNLEN